MIYPLSDRICELGNKVMDITIKETMDQITYSIYYFSFYHISSLWNSSPPSFDSDSAQPRCCASAAMKLLFLGGVSKLYLQQFQFLQLHRPPAVEQSDAKALATLLGAPAGFKNHGSPLHNSSISGAGRDDRKDELPSRNLCPLSPRCTRRHGRHLQGTGFAENCPGDVGGRYECAWRFAPGKLGETGPEHYAQLLGRGIATG